MRALARPPVLLRGAESRRVQHILDEDTIAAPGVVHENVGHGAHQLAVLQDRAAAHV